MSYHALTHTALGADTLEKCGQKLKSADMSTKAGREQSVKTGAECAADGYCAAYKVPPGVCGPIAKGVVGEAIKVWNSIFGDDSAQRAALQRRRESATYGAAREKMMDLETQMNADLAASAKKLIDFYNQMVPSRKGSQGGGPAYSQRFVTWNKNDGETEITITGYEKDTPMRLRLAANGLLHETKWIAPFELDPKHVNYYPIQPPNLMARMQGGMGMPAPADAWVNGRLAELRAPCMKLNPALPMQQGLVQQAFCLQKVPSTTVLRTQYAQSLDGIVIQFYETLATAEMLVRAAIAAEAIKARVQQHTTVSVTSSGTFASASGKAAALIVLAGAAAAALVLYQKRK